MQAEVLGTGAAYTYSDPKIMNNFTMCSNTSAHISIPSASPSFTRVRAEGCSAAGSCKDTCIWIDLCRGTLQTRGTSVMVLFVPSRILFVAVTYAVPERFS